MIKFEESNICDILPRQIAEKPEVKALGYSLNKALNHWLDKVIQSMVVSGVDDLPENILDERAAELRAPYYDASLPIETKRNIVKNTIALYKKAGTPAAVEQMIEYVFGSGELIEWFEYGGEPYTFKINTTAPVTPEVVEQLHKLLQQVKNTRSHLTSIERGLRLDAESYIGAGMIQASILVIK